jgi:hypothetical protein
VSRRGTWISNAAIIAAVTAVLLPDATAWASDGREVEELRAEVRQLQADLQALRGAMAEMSEVEQRYAALSKAPSGGPSPPEPRPAAPMLETAAETVGRAPGPPRVSSDATEGSARKTRHRRNRRSSRSRAKASASANDR